MQWLRRLFFALLTLLVILAGVAAWLLGTESGTVQLLRLARANVPGLEVGSARGQLLGRLELRDVHYRNPDLEAGARRLLLHWRPRALLSRRLHLLQLEFDGLTYRALRTTPARQQTQQDRTEPLQLPRLRLPMALQLDSVKIRNARFVTAPDATPLQLDALLMAARWEADGLHLQRLRLKAPQGRLAIEGRLTPRDPWPLDLTLHWELLDPALPRLHGQGRLHGALTHRLELDQAIGGELQAQLEARLQRLLERPRWQADLQVTRLPQKRIPVPLPATTRLALQAHGDLKRADLQLQARGRNDRNQAVLALELDGGIGFERLDFQVHGRWDTLQWPLGGAPQVITRNGTLEASGRPETYRFRLSTALAGPQMPAGEWQLQGDGNLESARIASLQGHILDGTLQATGQARWRPEPAWQIELQGQNLDPGHLDPRWPGRLQLQLASTGTLQQGRLQMDNRILQLEGRLHDQPVSGRGRVRLLGDTLEVDQLQLASGSARLQADGRLGARWDLNWHLTIPRLEDLLPDGHGAIQGEGRLEGSAEAPVARGRLAVDRLAWAAYRATRLHGDFQLGLDPDFDNRLHLEGRDLELDGQPLSELKLDLQGPQRDQRLALNLKHPQADLTLAARGALDLQQQRWQGRLARLALQGPAPLGHWKLQRPTPLKLSAEEVNVAPLCLQDGTARLCLQARRRGKTGQAELKLDGLSLERFHDWLPPQIERLDGTFQATAMADLHPPASARLEARLSPGRLVYLDAASHPVRLRHHDTRLQAVLDAHRLQADWQLKIDQHHAEGRLEIPRTALEADPKTAPVQGRIGVAITDLALIRALVPDIEQIQGHMQADLKLGGTLGDPRITGYARALADPVRIPRAGLELHQLELGLEGRDGRHWVLTGAVRSGPGRLALSGQATLDARQGWPARARLQGERFQVADLPEAQVLISPDLTVLHSGERIQVRGRLQIPKALIEINDLPAGVQSPSSDTVILSRDGTTPPPADSNKKLDLDVTIELGDQVHFAGFGLNVDLGGRLTVHVKEGKLPTANGELKILEGTFLAYGQKLDIARGTIAWAGGPIDNPLLKLEATRKVEDITVGVRVTGTAKKPRFTTFASDPDVTEKEAMTMLLTGQRSNDLTKASIYAGRQITPRLSVGVNVGGSEDGTEFVTRYKLRKNVTLEGTSSATRSGASINYIFELE